jgi:RNAse (barnase) inhibitor barstar
MARPLLIEISLSTVSLPQELHAALAKQLQFPDWYGANWDAFCDAITGLVEMPVNLHLIGWNDLYQRLPRDAMQLRSCLNEMAAEYPELAAHVSYT